MSTFNSRNLCGAFSIKSIKIIILFCLFVSVCEADVKVSGDEAKLWFYNGDFYVTFRASGSLAGNYNFVFPVNDGTAGQSLITDGSGVLSFSTISGGSGAPNDVDYLVGTASASLTNEIVVGATPGGELGGTWASPEIDDGLSVSGWSLTSATFLTGITATDLIVEAHLKAVNAAVDEDILTYESTTGDFEWHTLGELGGGGTDDQTIDVFSISGDNIQLSLEDDGEATKTVDVSTTTAVTANTAKNTNVSTQLSAGTVNATTYGITSDGGADDIVLPEADTDNAGLLGADKWDEIVANSAKVTNATHTGEVTGSGALAVDPTAISGKADVTSADADYMLIWDATDSLLKKCDMGEVRGDTTYTAGDALTLTGTDFDFDGGAAPAGELGGTWASPTVDSGIHDDEYVELGDSFSGDITGTYDATDITESILIDGGSDPIDGDKLEITATWDNITPDTGIAEADSVDDLAAILEGIDDALAIAAAATAWDDIGDPDAAATVDFTTYTQTIDIGKSDSGGGSGLILDVTGLGAGVNDVVALKITTATDDDSDYIPIEVRDDSGGNNDLLFQVKGNGDILGIRNITCGESGVTNGRLIVYSDDGHALGFQPNGTTTENTNYYFPADHGAANQVFGTDGAGNISWISHNSIAGLTTGDPHTQYLELDGSDSMTGDWDIGNFDITLKSLTGDGTIEGATLTEGGNAVWNSTETDIINASHINTINCGTNCTWDAANDEIDVDDAFLINDGDDEMAGKLTIEKITQQLELEYDGSNQADFTVGATGDLTITASGGGIDFGDENLTTTGDATIGIAFAGGVTSVSSSWDVSGDIVSYYKLDDDDAATTVDDEESNYDGTGSQITSSFHSATKKLGTGSFEFDGADDYVSIAKEVISQTAFSIAFWEYSSSSASQTQGYFFSDKSDVLNLFMRRIDSGAKYAWYLGEVNGGDFTITRDVWHFVVMTHDSSGNAELYVDDVLEDSLVGSNFTALATDLYIGNRNDLARDFEGWIDNFQVYDKELSAVEMWSLYNSGTGTESLSGGVDYDIQAIGTTSTMFPVFIGGNKGNLLIENDLEVKNDGYVGGDFYIAGDLYSATESAPWDKAELLGTTDIALLKKIEVADTNGLPKEFFKEIQGRRSWNVWEVVKLMQGAALLNNKKIDKLETRILALEAAVPNVIIPDVNVPDVPEPNMADKKSK